MSRRVAVVVAAVLVVSVFAPLAVVGGVAAQDGAEEGNVTDTPASTETPTATATATPTPTPTETESAAGSAAPTDSSGWTLDELRRDGQQPSDSPPSVRLGGDRMLWLVHWPARSMWADVGDPTDDSYEFVGERGPVSDSSVYIRSIRKDRGTDDFTVRVVSYRVDERETRADDGSTTTERVPADVRERSVDVSLGTGWSIAEVDLQNTDEDREVLMYVEGAENSLRWTFGHQPVATSQAAPISTEGDYLYRVAVQVFLPAVGFVFAGGFLSRAALRRAGKGPGLGFAGWGMLLGFVAFFGFIFGPIESTADLLVAAPTLFAVVLAIVTVIVILESYEVRTRKVLFVKLDPYNVLSPAASTDGSTDGPAATDGGQGEMALDAIFGQESSETVVEMPDGTEAVVRDGPLSFLSRAFAGCAARLPKTATRQSRVELEGGEHDEMIFVSPEFDANDEDSAIRFTPEGWEVRWPEIEDWRDLLQPAAIVGVIGVATLSVWSFEPVFGALVALAGGAVWLVRPTEGEAAFEPAKGHVRAAIVTAMHMATEVSDAETLEDARETIIRQNATKQKEIEAALDKQDSTIVEEAHSLDVERSFNPDANGSSSESLSEQLDDLEEVSSDDD